MTISTVTALVQPGAFCDRLTEVLRSGAQRLLCHAVEAEVAGFIEAHADERLDDGRARIVRHGHLPERDIQTGIGAVRVQQPRVRDRDSALTHHPHVHMIVPGGGISHDGKSWVSCRPGFFLSVRVLSRLFRRLFLDKLWTCPEKVEGLLLCYAIMASKVIGA